MNVKLQDGGELQQLQVTNQWAEEELDNQLRYYDKDGKLKPKIKYQINLQNGNIQAQQDYMEQTKIDEEEKEKQENTLREEEKIKEQLRLQNQEKKFSQNSKLLQRRYYDIQLHKEYSDDDLEELEIQANQNECN
ncbi:Hypothetical protein CINCED_3A014951 [Cinara cedri]|uniref:Uncharacterized protein n=1 Tax=Cinara cedri TaxID=506608 RepID=A0A5E4MQG2_9HEMI|nr:Hypothetical protein CINCED_3A014951 [Cinara cedri]